jgi:hypothetical protein
MGKMRSTSPRYSGIYRGVGAACEMREGGVAVAQCSGDDVEEMRSKGCCKAQGARSAFGSSSLRSWLCGWCWRCHCHAQNNIALSLDTPKVDLAFSTTIFAVLLLKYTASFKST